MSMETDIITYSGQAVKATDDGRVSGYVVIFSTPNDPDLANEFFTPETDFGLEEEGTKSAVLYQHGLDKTIKGRKLGKGVLKQDAVGIWIDGQLDLRDDYERGIHELAKKGKLGWSSGTAKHLVEYEEVGGAKWIKSWPLGLDASLTPTPCEPRTRAISLKSLMQEADGRTFADEIQSTIGTIKATVDRIKDYADMKAKDNRRVNPERREQFIALKGALDEVIAATAPQPDPEIEALKIEWLREKNRRSKTR